MSAALHLISDDKAGTPCSQSRRALVADLPANARLLLWAMRLLAESRGNWAIVQQELWLCCGLASVENVLQALEEMLTLLARESRRPLIVKPSEAKCMSAGEDAVMAMIQAARGDQSARLVAHARWLVRPLAQRDLIFQALRLGQGVPDNAPRRQADA